MYNLRDRLIILITLLILFGSFDAMARGGWTPDKKETSRAESLTTSLIRPTDLRHVAVHDAGDYYTAVSDGLFSAGFITYSRDPETGNLIMYTTYPRDSGICYTFSGAIWVGGIIGEDTLVSVAADGWFYYTDEMHPVNTDSGGIYRRNGYADDEFVMVMRDSGVANVNGNLPRGLDIEITQISYSWSDTLYDDFVIFEYTIENIGQDSIKDGSVGFYFDHDIYHISQASNGWSDDCSGFLDTLLYDDDPESRMFVSYSYDNDGNPVIDSGWTEFSARGVISMRIMDCSFEKEYENFNWWQSSGVPNQDFGPRRVGTPDDPLRLFAQDNLGTAISDGDKYYLMTHPEIDYPTMETLIHDSADGWVPAEEAMAFDYADGLDTRYLHSIGPFNLPPGESVSFAMVRVAGRDFHQDYRDFADYFDHSAPGIYQNRLDFTELMINHRRVDSVYKSGMMLPRPGAPMGLAVSDYDDAYVDLFWNTGTRPDLAGYHLYIKDTLLDTKWKRVFQDMLTDTTARCPIMSPAHEYSLAISLVDASGRESALSLPVTIIPGRPHPPENFTADLEGLIPTLNWTPPKDTAFLAFMIYRAVWDGSFELHDSTTALSYQDYNTESGYQYYYLLSAKNDLDYESEAVGPVMAIPMAMDLGALFINRNVDHPSNLIGYQPEYMESLYESLAALTLTDRIDVEDGPTFKDIADHSPVIFSAESRSSNLWWPTTDWIQYYLNGGGKVIFILLSGSLTNITQGDPRVNRFGEGDFFHDYLKLDSSVTNPMIISYPDTAVFGDLAGCRSVHPQYVSLAADTGKYDGPIFDVMGGLPMSGYLFPTAEAEPLYSYISSNPDTVNEGQINGIRYLSEDYSFVMLNFSLAMMEEPKNFYVLRQAMIDLGVELSCGDIREDGRTTLGDIVYLVNYLYRSGAEPPNFRNADVNCDSVIDLADIITMINFLIRQESWLNCCP